MKMLAAALIAAALFISLAVHGNAGESAITISELNGRKITGVLGAPLGKVVSIEGTVVADCFRKMKSDEGETLLKVERVDGRAVKAETIIPLRMVPSGSLKMPEPGYRFCYRGYESGSFTGIPEEAFRYMPQASAEGFQFRTYFLVIREEKSRP
jgi:hypothetical protein